LRAAITEREQALRRLDDWERAQGGAASPPGAHEAPEATRAALEAELQRSRALVAFYRRRLDQVVQDCDADIRAIKANLEVIRSRYESQHLDDAAYQDLELALLRAKSDMTSMRDLVQRAIRAASAAQVPMPKGTYLKRISKPAPSSVLSVDCWLAWLASGMMLAGILALMLSQQIHDSVLDLRMASLALFFSALFLSILALIPRREVRGTLFTVFWVCACLSGALFLHEARYSENALGTALRLAPSTALRIEVGIFAVCALMAGTPAFAALMPLRRQRKIPLLGTLILVVSLWGIQSDFGGVFMPRPAIGQATVHPEDSRQPLYEVSIPVYNHGRRPLWLGGRLDMVPTPVKYVLERRVGAGQWENVLSLRADGTDSDAHDFRLSPLKLTGGAWVNLPYRLPAGVYRVRLSSSIPGFEQIESSFTLAPLTTDRVASPPPPRAETPSLPAGEDLVEESPDMGEERGEPPGRYSPPVGIEIVLRGVITGEGRPARFVVDVTRRSGATKRLTLSLGEQVYGPWAAYEFSPANKTLTLFDGERLVILQRGQPEMFPIADPVL
jgi:hypothetical protein